MYQLSIKLFILWVHSCSHIVTNIFLFVFRRKVVKVSVFRLGTGAGHFCVKLGLGDVVADGFVEVLEIEN